MKNIYCFIGLICCLQATTGQKIIKKSIVSNEVTSIQIDVASCFEIDVMTSKNREMKIEAQFEGEYEKALLLTIVEDGSTLRVGADFQPNFEKPNDKLSAHKVVSIALKVRLPEQKVVHVFGTNCTVRATGAYDQLKISLNDGRCELDQVSGKVEVRTQSGTIKVRPSKAQIVAKSKYGEVLGNSSSLSEDHFKLNSVTGDILLN